MPIEVRAPDGAIVRFPDGMPDADIERVMQREYGGGDPFAGQPYNENEARAATLARGATFALNDEIQGAGAAIAAPFRGRSPGAEFDRASRRTRALTERYRTERPVGGVADEVAGGVLAFGLPGLARAVTGQAAAQAPQVGRGVGEFVRQSGRAGAVSAGTGYAYGFNDQGNLSERLNAGNQSAAVGGALGLATPAAVNAVGAVARPVARGIGGALSRIGPAPNTLGAGPVVSVRPPPPGGSIPPDTGRRLATLAGRARMSADDVANAAGEAQRQRLGTAVVDLFGDAGTRQLRPLVQAPGQTGQRAAELAEQRLAAAPARLAGELRRRLGVGETRIQALQRLEGEYARASAEQYQPIFRERLPAANRARLEQFLAPYADDPVFVRARENAERIFARDRRSGIVSGDLEDNFARWTHYIKMGLDDAAQFSRSQQSGIGATELRGIRDMRTRIIAAIDEAIPGYQAARQRWGGLVNAEEALEEGSTFLRMIPDEVQQRVRQMTPFELEHARIGLSDQVRRITRGRVVGQGNAANALNDPDIQGSIAAVFDTPQQAAEYISIVNTTNRLNRNAAAWGAGSQTQGNQAYEADGAVRAIADAGGDMLGGRWGQAVNRAGRQIGNAIGNNIIERSNDRFGELLTRQIDEPTSRAFVQEMVALLRRLEAQAQTNAAASRAVSPIAGQQGGRRGE